MTRWSAFQWSLEKKFSTDLIFLQNNKLTTFFISWICGDLWKIFTGISDFQAENHIQHTWISETKL